MKRIALSLIIASVVLADDAWAQRQVQKVTASNGAAHDEFGASTAMDGDWAIIGAPLNDDRAFQGGAAYVFHRVGGLWSETQELLASDGGSPDEFGCSVSMSGDFAVIGAFDNDTPAASQSGAAYVFERVGLAWFERAKLVASDASPTALFGNVVAISGDRIAVGAWNAGSTGKVYVFERAGTMWQQAAILVPSDTLPVQAFGKSIAIDGDLIAGSSLLAWIQLPVRQGVSWVFRRNAQGAWLQEQKLYALAGANNDLFGDPISISGDTISAGAAGRHAFTGAAFIFQYNGTSWVQAQELVPTDALHGDSFSGLYLLGSIGIGGSGSDPDTGAYSGTEHVFQRFGSVWTQTGKLIADDAHAGNQIGRISVSGTSVLLGAIGANDACPQAPSGCATGAAYFFELAPTTIQYGSCLTGSPCSNNDCHGGCRNSTGQGAILQASGSGSVTTDDLVMEVRHLPPFAPGLIFMGGAQTTTPFGSGQLVVADDGKGIYRIEIHFSDADGVFLHGPGNVALTQGIPNPLGHITAGDTWNFQCWYRDQQGPCGAGFNLTNGLQVSYVP